MRLSTLLVLSPLAAGAQTLVSTMPQDRTGLLEVFTAINCPNCPAGHAVAANLLAAHPGDLVVVNLHGGVLATPSGGQPDLRTTWGTSIWGQFGVTAQPTGMVNRTAYNGQLVMSRTSWAGALAANLATPTEVNIGAATTFDAGTRDLTVNVELYYTSNGSGGNDRVHVLLTEDHIVGFQASGGANYSHDHVLRAYLGPLWGDELPNNNAGDLDQRTYTFNVPMDWNIANCHVVAFVGEYQGGVHNVVEIGADNFSTGLNEDRSTRQLHLFPQPVTDQLFVAHAGAAGTTEIVIRDMAGRAILRDVVAATDGAFAINVAALTNGAYVLQVDGLSQRFLVAR